MAAGRILVVLLVVSMTLASAAWADDARVPRSAIRLPSAQSFADVWIVDRDLPELYQVLAVLARDGQFRPIVLAAAEGRTTRAAELDHLLEVVPENTSRWVSHDPVPTGLNVDVIVRTDELMSVDDGVDTAVYCPDGWLEPLAALAAMRMGAALTTVEAPPSAARVIQFGGEPGLDGRVERHVAGRGEALEFVNAMATRTAVLVYEIDDLLPEYVLYAFQRGALMVEVAPPAYDSYDPSSELAATLSTRDQIHAVVAGIEGLGGELPEALVVAGDWSRIPYRFPRSAELECDHCENGVAEHSSDVEYANFDGDEWGEPDVAVGRLMSYERDLLSLQTVLGVWRDAGAFPSAPRAALLEMLGAPYRDEVFEGWRGVFEDRDWEIAGPRTPQESFSYVLDREEFFFQADDSDVVLVRGHGLPDFLGAGSSRVQLNGAAIAATALDARPAFWIVEACATGRYLDPQRHTPGTRRGNYSLISGIQSRLALGSLLSVEVVTQGSANLWWPTMSLESGITVGELMRRGAAAAVSYYRGDEGVQEPPVGLARHSGTDTDHSNAWVSTFWVGDPLTTL